MNQEWGMYGPRNRAYCPPTRPAQSRPVHDAADLGAIVKRCRKSQGLAIDDAAALSSVSQDSYSRLERASGGIGTDRLFAILDSLGLEMQLVDKSRSMPAATSEIIKRFEP